MKNSENIILLSYRKTDRGEITEECFETEEDFMNEYKEMRRGKMKGEVKQKIPYPTINLEATGQKIKQIMREQNRTVYEIQEYLGFQTVQGIYRWFRGNSMPTIDNLYALSKLFQVPIDEILCGN